LGVLRRQKRQAKKLGTRWKKLKGPLGILILGNWTPGPSTLDLKRPMSLPQEDMPAEEQAEESPAEPPEPAPPEEESGEVTYPSADLGSVKGEESAKAPEQKPAGGEEPSKVSYLAVRGELDFGRTEAASANSAR